MATATTTPACPVTSYVVQPGDTLSSIAAQFGLDVATLAAANGLADVDLILAGQILTIPCVVEESPALPPGAVSVSPTLALDVTPQALGTSFQGRPIEVYRFGNGSVRLAFVGAIHGGYEWNTALLAYRSIDYFAAHPEAVPTSVSLYIVPSANPDGLVRVVGHVGRFSPAEVQGDTIPGRFNDNNVDLNRNWDCDWKPTAIWRDRPINAGAAPFSEPETRILRDLLADPPMQGVVFWHSAIPGVFPGGCGGRFEPSDRLGTVYADASGYPFQTEFGDYRVTGDATDWLSLHNIPAIVVELNNHTDTDWEQNLRGMLALLQHFDSGQDATEGGTP